MLQIFNKHNLTFGIALSLWAVAAPTYAATLSFANSGSYSVGDAVSVPVLVSTASGESANAVSATISYPASLQLVSISKAGSIVGIWPSEPSYGGGTAHLEGVILNPGFSGTRGTVATLVFKAVAAGTGVLIFSDAQVLANDGQGTNILTSAPSASYTVTTPKSQQTTVSSSVSIPTIQSSTHPKQTSWYKSTRVALSWGNLVGTKAVRVGYDKDPNGTPSVQYDVITQKYITLAEGVWYFHVQDQTSAGWSDTGTYKIQIDTTPPNPVHITFPHGATTTDPRPVALFNTTDDLSGIDHYEVFVNGNSLVTLQKSDVQSNPYAIPQQGPGPGTIKVVAYDAAGNVASDTQGFDIQGTAVPKLDPIADIQESDLLEISGIALPSARVDIYLTDSSGNVDSQWTRTAGNGAFKVVWIHNLPTGTYQLSAQSTDTNGAVSAKTNPVTFQVKPLAFLHVGPVTIIRDNLVRLLVLLSLLIAAAVWHWRRTLRLVANHPHRKAHAVISKQFAELKDAVEEEVHKLEKVRSHRQLTVEEERFINRFSKLLDKVQIAIEREVD